MHIEKHTITSLKKSVAERPWLWISCATGVGVAVGLATRYLRSTSQTTAIVRRALPKSPVQLAALFALDLGMMLAKSLWESRGSSPLTTSQKIQLIDSKGHYELDGMSYVEDKGVVATSCDKTASGAVVH